MPFWGTALFVASDEGHAGVVKVLLQAGASPDSGVPDVSPLNMAASKGHVEVMRLLLAHGATVDANQDRGTPLAHAAVKGNINAMEPLLTHGAIPNATDARGEGPLHLAVRYGRLDAVRLLLARGANKPPALLAILDDPTRTKTPDDAALRPLLEK